MICESSEICKLSTPQYNNALRPFHILKQFFSKFWKKKVNDSLLLIANAFFLKTANTGLRLRLTETVEHLHAYVSAIYNQALKESLRSLEITPGRALLQCVDDLMICAPTEEYCEKDTVAHLKHLAAEGHIMQAWKTAVS